MAVLGVRQDLTFKVLDQAVVSDDAGKIILNSAQQDSVILRVVARYGFAVGVPATLQESISGSPYPFATLEGAITTSTRSSRTKGGA
jgi:hypothetical protein